jgi:uncharacterized integral membrane protein
VVAGHSRPKDGVASLAYVPAISVLGKASPVFRKIVTAIIVVPPAVVLVAFSLANRQTVTVSFDPFSSMAPAYAVTLPLFIIIFAVLILGVLVGGLAAWLRQGKWRRSALRLEAEVHALHDEMDSIRRRFGTAQLPPSTAEPSPMTAIPPPIP